MGETQRSALHSREIHFRTPGVCESCFRTVVYVSRTVEIALAVIFFPLPHIVDSVFHRHVLDGPAGIECRILLGEPFVGGGVATGMRRLRVFATMGTVHAIDLALSRTPDVLGQIRKIDKGIAVFLLLLDSVVTVAFLIAHGVVHVPFQQQVRGPVFQQIRILCVVHPVGTGCLP